MKFEGRLLGWLANSDARPHIPGLLSPPNRPLSLCLTVEAHDEGPFLVMRIIHFLNHVEAFNGHVNVAVDLACLQAKLGHEVTVISGGGRFEPLLDANGVKHVRIDLSRRPLNLIRALYKLRGALSELNPEIVHTHMVASNILAYALRPFMKFRLINTIHNEFDKSAIFMGLGDRAIAVSRAVATSMARRGIPESKLRVVINGTTGSPRLSPELPQPKELKPPAIVFVGGMHPRKGVADLIAAFKIVGQAHASAHLYLVGGGPFRETYEKQAAETGFGDRIQFCRAQAEPRAYLLAADLFVLPSHAEPGGLVLTEAREAGCAIIATSVGGSPEMLDDGRAGLLVPAKRPDLLAEAMLKVLNDPVLQADLRSRARENVDYFKLDRVVQDYLSHYQELLSPAGR